MLRLKTTKVIILGMLMLSLFSIGCDSTAGKRNELKGKIKNGSLFLNDYLELGKIYFEKGQYRDSLKYMDALLKLYNSSNDAIIGPYKDVPSDAYSYRGKALYLLGDKEKAEEAFKRSGKAAYGYYQLGFILYDKQKNEDVVECMNKCIELDKYPGTIGAYILRGKSFFNLGKIEEGKKDLILAAGKGSSEAGKFLDEKKINWDGPEKEKYEASISSFISRTNESSGKNFSGRDEVFNKLRDDIGNSNMSFEEKARAKVKLHDDMYKE